MRKHRQKQFKWIAWSETTYKMMTSQYLHPEETLPGPKHLTTTLYCLS